ncbi:hypothetical protein QBC37DRAFT_102427 [Rhypophila decipiens]|uniref:Uncharacterized protein n=1 Tax=Rhypophila decipiens TaxID=261697 RepID=A0AAN6XX11_9PEZI|nr:hypothetical protein QBC37DRAFT_102427 [Rhypophila decipiens]
MEDNENQDIPVRSNSSGIPNSNSTSPQYPKADIETWIQRLDSPTQRRLLLQAATHHADMASSIKAQHDALQGEEFQLDALSNRRHRENLFAEDIRTAIFELGLRLPDYPPAEQRERADKVTTAIEEILESIADQVEGSDPWEKKYDGLEAIRTIFEEVLGSASGVVGNEVRKGVFTWGIHLVNVIGKFTEEELEELRAFEAQDGSGRMYVEECLADTAALSEFMEVDTYLHMYKALGILRGEKTEDESEE